MRSYTGNFEFLSFLNLGELEERGVVKGISGYVGLLTSTSRKFERRVRNTQGRGTYWKSQVLWLANLKSEAVGRKVENMQQEGTYWKF